MSLEKQAVAVINQHCPNASPLIGIVLGSGLGSLIDDIQNSISIPYSSLPGFPTPSVKGHEGNLILGILGGVSVVCLQGRSHTYEHGSHDAVIHYVRTLKLLGCVYFLATNASGSLRDDFLPGDLVLINDHINMQGSNPLVGLNNDDFGPRFPPMDNAYDKELRVLLCRMSTDLDINLRQGVYMCVMGPSYETPAEVRAFRSMGADVVGMSTVPEVIVATHCGMRVAVIATVTNFAAGAGSCGEERQSHESVITVANEAAVRLKQLVKAFVSALPERLPERLSTE